MIKANIILSCLVVFNSLLNAQVNWKTIKDGNWSDPSIWNRTGDILGDDSVELFHNIVLDVNAKILNLTIHSNASLTNSSQKLHIRGDFNSLGTYYELNNGWTLMSGSNIEDRFIKGEIYFNRLDINAPGRTIIVAAGSSIFIKDRLNLNNGILNVSQGNLTLLNDSYNNGRLGTSPNGQITGDFFWQKYIDRCNEWSTYTSPFTTTLETYAANSNGRMIFTGFPTSDFPTFPFINTYFYTQATGYVVPTSISNTLNRGEAFWYWNSNQVYNSSSPSIPQQWLVQVKGSLDLASTFSFPVSYGGDNFNLLGNPYPGTINWDNSNFVKTNINNAIYVFNTCTQSYSSYINGIGTNGGSRYLPSGQGFFVESNAESPNLISTQAVLVNNDVSLKSANPNVLYLELLGDEIAVAMNNEATTDFDYNYDARYLESDNAHLYTNLNNNDYSINVIEEQDIVIPLFLNTQGDLNISGVASFTNYDIYIEDVETNEVYDLQQQSTISFVNVNSGFSHKFNIRFSKKILSTSDIIDNNISIYPNPVIDEIQISSKESISKVEFFNTLGQQVYSKSVSFNKGSITLSNLSSGSYSMKIHFINGGSSSTLINKL